MKKDFIMLLVVAVPICIGLTVFFGARGTDISFNTVRWILLGCIVCGGIAAGIVNKLIKEDEDADKDKELDK